MMSFALLGLDETLWPLVRSLAHAGANAVLLHEIPEAWQSELQRLFPTARRADTWDELLALPAETPVLVARAENEDLRAEQLRKLIQQAQTLVVSHPVLSSMVVMFELEMIRADTGALVLPWSTGRYRAGYSTVLARLRDHESGTIDQLCIEHPLRDSAPRTVLAAFAGDMHLARGWVGELTKLSALASDRHLGNLGVQLSGPGGTIVRWSAVPAREPSVITYTFLGSTGGFTTQFEIESQSWLPPPTANVLPVELANQLRLELDRRRQLVASQPSWLDACRDVELADAVERSAAKGKTIELYLESVNEENTFKGMMAAGGCLLLLVTLPLMVLATTVTNLDWPLVHYVEYWPYALLLILGVFLGLQTLRLAFPSAVDPPDPPRQLP